jgi:hypothetical protein
MAEPWRQTFIDSAKKLQPAGEIRTQAHLKKSISWGYVHNGLGVSIALLSFLTGVIFITPNLKQFEYIIPYTAILTAILSVINTYIKPGDKKANNEIAYKLYATLCNDIKFYFEIECMQRYDNVREAQSILKDSYKKLNDRLSKLMQDSPMLTQKETDDAITELKKVKALV